MRCPRCQFDNPPTMNFCVQCGARLERRCPRCGAETQPTFKFCGQCGAALGVPEPAHAQAPMAKAQVYQRQEAKIPSYTPRHLAEKILTSRSALEGERRQVTVLFADVANFTTLAEKLDPEVVHEIIDGCFEQITDRRLVESAGVLDLNALEFFPTPECFKLSTPRLKQDESVQVLDGAGPGELLFAIRLQHGAQHREVRAKDLL